MVDLSDDSGNLKYLRGHPESYATEFLKDRESLVLIRVDSKYRIGLSIISLFLIAHVPGPA
jgi:hypothetical protein